MSIPLNFDDAPVEFFRKRVVLSILILVCDSLQGRDKTRIGLAPEALPNGDRAFLVALKVYRVFRACVETRGIVQKIGVAGGLFLMHTFADFESILHGPASLGHVVHR